MMQWIFKLLGVPPSSGTMQILFPPHLSLHPSFGNGWFVFFALLAVAVVVFAHFWLSEGLSLRKKITLTTVRCAFLSLLLLLMARPSLEFNVQGSVRRTMLLLVDGSSSMKTDDERKGDDLLRAAIAKGVVDPKDGLKAAAPAGGGLDRVPRIDLVKWALKNEKLNLIPRLARDYDLRPWVFETELRDITPADPLASSAAQQKEQEKGKVDLGPRINPALAQIKPAGVWIDPLDGKSGVSPIGDSLRDLIGRSRGLPLAGIIMMTDGASNRGMPPQAAAELAKQAGVPLYIYGVGTTSPKNISVTSIFAPDVVFADDEVAITVRLRGQGLAGESARVNLTMAGQKFEGTDVVFDGNEQVISMTFKPKKAGDEPVELVASIDPRDDELTKEDNSFSHRVKVVDGKIKVLYVEQAPRWEFRYLQAMLARDRRIDAKFLLLEADPAFSSQEKSPYLSQFPIKREDLFKYDVVIWGDVDTRNFTNQQLESIHEFVTIHRGGLLVIAGRRYGVSMFKNTVFEKMLPVELSDDRGGRGGLRADTTEIADQPIRLEMTPSGKRSVMLRLSDKETESDKLWGQLPPIYWAARVAQAKNSAEVYLVDPDPAKATRFGKMPVFASHHDGLGLVFFAGTDNTWRWRKNNADQHYTTLWGQIIQQLGLPHLLGESQATQISFDKKQYVVGDRVTVYARLFNTDFTPAKEEKVRAFYRSESGNQQEIWLVRVKGQESDQEGIYVAEFPVIEPGTYTFWAERDEKVRKTFPVIRPKIEPGETAMVEEVLKQMAEVSGGAFYREEDLVKLPDDVKAKTELVRSHLEIEVWSSGLYYLALLAIVTFEWILRKVYQVK